VNGFESELRVAIGNILHSVKFGEKNINLKNNNNLEIIRTVA